GADQVFVMIAENGVQHRKGISVHCKNERLCPLPTGGAKEISVPDAGDEFGRGALQSHGGGAPRPSPRRGRCDHQ
ncbi:MAG: hypothetical protein ACK463_03200, partial [Bradyrhizobium sp.]